MSIHRIKIQFHVVFFKMNEFLILKKKRWICLILFCLANFFTGALYIWSVFSGPLAQKIGLATSTNLTAADISPVFGVATGVTPFLMLAGGYINDKFGPRFVIAAGGLFIGIGYLLCAVSESISMLYIAYGLLVGIGTGMVNGCTINCAVKFFPDKRGFAGGTVTAFLGVGAACLPFVVNWLIREYGISTACTVFGICAGLVIFTCGLLTFKCPDDFALCFTSSARAKMTKGLDVNWLGMIRSPLFIPLYLLFVCGSTMGLMLISSMSGIAEYQIGVGTALAATSVSVISLANTTGRFLSGTVSDMLGRVQTLVLMLSAAVLGFFLLIQSGRGDLTTFMSGIVLVGICYGAFIGTYPSLIADEFGHKHNSVNFSLMMTGYSIGGIGGPILLRLASKEGSYVGAYATCIGLAVVGALCAAAYFYLKRREAKTSR